MMSRKTFKIIPKVSQRLANGDVYYNHDESLNACFKIKCPAENARTSIGLKSFFRFIDTSFRFETVLTPATVGDYSTAIKNILHFSPYDYYTVSDKLLVNTQMAQTGPFYPDVNSCEVSTFDEPAFWFAEPPEFVEGDFYDSSEERCVGRLTIRVISVMDPDLLNKLKVSDVELDFMSIWLDNKYGRRKASLKVISPLSPPQDRSGWYND